MDGSVPPIVPYLTVADARGALEFYARAFGAETLLIQEDDTGVFHARTRIAGGIVMLYEEKTGAPAVNRAPATYGGSSVAVRVDLGTADAVDRVADQARAAGGEILVAPVNRPCGRLAEVRDPEGHLWRLAAETAGSA